MKVALCTLVLNEMEWLPYLYEQHRNWPGLVKWVFVESADRVYAQSAPDMVTDTGLSVDGTTEYLKSLAQGDESIIHIPYGFSSDRNPDQGKCESRNLYLRAIDADSPDFFFVLDADEFYSHQDQEQINQVFEEHRRTARGFCFDIKQIWRPPSIADSPLFSHYVRGGFWDIPHCRCWRWEKELSYDGNHNTPSDHRGFLFSRNMLRVDRIPDSPYGVHLGYASSEKVRAAKAKYYEDRGEKTDHRRSWYTGSRRAWFDWKPGQRLPRGARVLEYDGRIPECFLGEE